MPYPKSNEAGTNVIKTCKTIELGFIMESIQVVIHLDDTRKVE